MPIELQPYLTADYYHALMGLCGIVTAFVIMLIWSQGL